MSFGNDVEVKVGADTSAAQAGLAELRNYGKKAHEELTGIFSKAIAFGGILEGFAEVINKAHEIHHESERFGIDAQQLQLIGNAAKEQGVGLETVARAMNKLALSGEGANSSLETLGINTAEWIKMDPAERFYAVADATQKAGINAGSYAAVGKLLGTRFGTELIPVLLQGSAAIRAQSDALSVMGDNTIEQLEKIHRGTERIKNDLVGGLGSVFVTFVNSWRTGWYAIGTLATIYAESVVTSFQAINKAAHLDFAGAKKDLEEFKTYAEEMYKGIAEYEKEQFGRDDPAEKKKPAGSWGDYEPPAETPDEGGGKSGGGRRGGSSGSDLLQKEHEAYMRLLNDNEKLNELQTEREDIQTKLDERMKAGTLSSEEEDGLRADILDKDSAITDQQDKITAEKAKQDELDQKARDKAEEQLAVGKEQTAELQAQLAGHGDKVKSMHAEFEFQQKIKDLAEQITAAEAAGNTELATTLEQLKEQVIEEKRITDEIERRNEQKKAYDKASSASALTTEALRSGQQSFDLSHSPKLQAMLAQNSNYGFGLSYATGMAGAGASEDQIIAKLSEWSQKTDFGKRNLSFMDQANLDHRLNSWADEESKRAVAASAAADAAQQQQSLGVNDSIARYGSRAFDQNPVLAALLAQILAAQNTTNKKLTPPPGG